MELKSFIYHPASWDFYYISNFYL